MSTRVIGILLSALALLGVIVAWKSAEGRARSAEHDLAQILQAARALSSNPQLERDGIAAQLWVLDEYVDKLETSAADCSAKVDALGAEQARLAKVVTEARLAAAGRISAAERSKTALEASAAHAAPGGPSCLSPELKRRWP